MSSHSSLLGSERKVLDELLKVVARISAGFPNTVTSVIRAPLNGIPIDLVRMQLPPQTSLYFIPSPYFPEVPPTIMVQWNKQDDREYLTIEWSVDGSADDKLGLALKAFIAPSETYEIVYGCDPARPLTCCAETAALVGWRRLLTDAPMLPASAELARTRINPALVDAFANSNVMLVGLGSVGSYIAEQLTRSGIGKLTIIDHDIVENSNLSRTGYDVSDIGLSKVKALQRRLLNIAPDLQIDGYESEFQKVGGARLRQLFEEADLVIAASDDPVAQAQINSCCQFADRPSLHIGLYRGAKGGEIVIGIPKLTPCFRCQVGGTRNLSSSLGVDREVDYGSGRLRGEVALGCDIQHVSSAGIKLALSLLAALKGVDDTISEFTLGAVQRKLSMITLGMEPDWWFYPEVFDNTSGQYAYQSVWLNSEANPLCPDCGAGVKTDPFSAVAPSINVDELRAQIDDDDMPD